MKKLLQLILKPLSLVGRGLAIVGRPLVKPIKFTLRLLLKPFSIFGNAVLGTLALSDLLMKGINTAIVKLQGVLYLTALYLLISLGFSIYLRMVDGRILLPNLPPYQSLDILPNGTELYESLVKLYTEDGHFFCSGSVVSNKYILTAGHCLDGDFARGDLKIYTKNGQDSGATGQAAALSRSSDIGLILGDFSKFRKAQVSRIGIIGHTGPFVTCGSPHGDPMICVPYQPISTADFMIAGKSFLYKGMSGGPVYDESTGEIVAVNSRVSGPGSLVAPTVAVFGQFGIESK